MIGLLEQIDERRIDVGAILHNSHMRNPWHGPEAGGLFHRVIEWLVSEIHAHPNFFALD